MTTFKFGGTDLSDFGNITLIDEYLDIAARRGNNLIVAQRHGMIHQEKFYDERTIAFGIAITATSLSDLESTLDDLRELISPRETQTLEITMEDATVRQAQASVDKPINVRRKHNFARVVVEFTLAEPFFRLSTAIADNTTTINANPKAMTVNNVGTMEERDPIITLTGPLANTVITNSTNGCVLSYAGTIAAGKTVIIQTEATGEYSATHSDDGNVIGNVTHSGASALMVLDVGNNSLSIADDTHTTGTVKVSFHAPFA